MKKLKLSRLKREIVVPLSCFLVWLIINCMLENLNLKLSPTKPETSSRAEAQKRMWRRGPRIRIFYPFSVLRRQQILRSLNLFFIINEILGGFGFYFVVKAFFAAFLQAPSEVGAIFQFSREFKCHESCFPC